ncbi:MAG TPA: tryptophan synthase subunit alpha [Steroidobacteraceae bacterium]|nr:tryptophan synthase subunit alpha [Steroidobacteraceae bacterium]
MSQTPAQKLADSLRAVRRERVALVTFLTAGYPSKDRFLDDLRALAAESDMVEIGVPFTDPMADGVTIQRSSFAALAQGVTLAWILDAMKSLPKLNAQLVFMGYFNPMLAYGLERLARDAAAVGISGFIVPDLPIEESGAFEQALGAHGLALIRMVTPVTPLARLEQLCRSAQGFVYAVSMTGTTGSSVGGQAGVSQQTIDYLKRVRKLSPVPVCAGFGIREHAQVAALAPHVDGVVVGSAIIEAMEKGESPAALLRRLRDGP